MVESTNAKISDGGAGTAAAAVQIFLRKNEVIELLKALDGLKTKLQMLLK